MSEVTINFLQMTDAAMLRPKACEDPKFHISEKLDGHWRINLELYKRVGADWQWRDRLQWSVGKWRSHVMCPGLRTFVAYHGDEIAGYFELYVHESEVQIAILGLIPDYSGKGLGGPLLTRALEEAWAMEPTRVWVSTCSRDHPNALVNYQARGMEVYKTVTESDCSAASSA